MPEDVRVRDVEIIAATESALTCRIGERELSLPRPPVRIESTCMGRADLRVPSDLAAANGLAPAAHRRG